LGFITLVENVYSAVRTDSLYKAEYPKESIQHSGHGESLKSRIRLVFKRLTMPYLWLSHIKNKDNYEQENTNNELDVKPGPLTVL